MLSRWQGRYGSPFGPYIYCWAFFLSAINNQTNKTIKMLAFVCHTVGLFVVWHCQRYRLICFIIRWTRQRDSFFVLCPRFDCTAIGAPLICLIRWLCVSWCWSCLNRVAGINCWFTNKQTNSRFKINTQRFDLSSQYLVSILMRSVQLQWPLTFPLNHWICSYCYVYFYFSVGCCWFDFRITSLWIAEKRSNATAKICVYAPGYWPLWILFIAILLAYCSNTLCALIE